MMMKSQYSYILIVLLGSVEIRCSRETYCLDVSPYCSAEDCWIRPGYAMEFCRKTCGNCQESLCYDSEYYPCVGMDTSGCSKYLKDYCPVLCGVCEPTEYEPTADDDSLSFFPRNSTFLGLFQPSQWIGQPFSTTQSTSTYSTTAQPIIATTASGIEELTTAYRLAVSVSIASTEATTSASPVTKGTTLASISSPNVENNSAAVSKFRSLVTDLTRNRSIASSSTPTSNPKRTTPLSSSTKPTMTPPLLITMPIETASTPAVSVDNSTKYKTTNAITTSQTTQPSTTTAATSETTTTTPTLSSTSHGQDIVTTELPPVVTTTSTRKASFKASEWLSYIRELTKSARTSKQTSTRGSTGSHSILQPKLRPNTKTHSFANLPVGAGRTNRPRANQSQTSRRLIPTKTAIATPPSSFARSNQRQLFYRPPRPSSASTPATLTPLPTPIPGAWQQSQQRERAASRQRLRPPSSLSHRTASIADIVTLLGCRDHDERTCSQIDEVTCRARPGYYLKLCPVKCKNCNGLLCYDSNKVDCAKVVASGGCQLQNAADYCPQSCDACPKPAYLSDSGARCKDEFPTCKNLAASGICHHVYNVEMLRLYCAKSCGFCKESPFYFMDATQYYPELARQ